MPPRRPSDNTPRVRGGSIDGSRCGDKCEHAALTQVAAAIKNNQLLKDAKVEAEVDECKLTVTISSQPVPLDLSNVAPCEDIILEMLLVYYIMQLSWVAQEVAKAGDDASKAAAATAAADRIKDKVDAFSLPAT